MCQVVGLPVSQDPLRLFERLSALMNKYDTAQFHVNVVADLSRHAKTESAKLLQFASLGAKSEVVAP